MPRRSWWALAALVFLFLFCRGVDLWMDRRLRLQNEENVLSELKTLQAEAPRFEPFFLRAGWMPSWSENKTRDAGEILNQFFPWTSGGIRVPWVRGGSRLVSELFDPETKRIWLETQDDGVPLAARLKTASAWDLSSVHEQILGVLRTYDFWDPTTGVGLPMHEDGVLVETVSQQISDLLVFAELSLAKRLKSGNIGNSRDDLRHLARLCVSRGDYAGLQCGARLERLIHALEIDTWDEGEPLPYDGEPMWAHLASVRDLWLKALSVPQALEILDANLSSPAACAGLTESAIHARLWQWHFDRFDKEFVQSRLAKVAASPCQATWIRRHLEGQPVWAPIEIEEGPNFINRTDLWFWRLLFPRWSRWL